MASASPAGSSPDPVAIVCIGMAGAGKTTFLQRINAHLHAQKQPPYVVNLDPAVRSLPFESNIDIRDSVNYKEVMKQYNLGPNGGILTSLNLFATKIDQVLGILEKRTKGDPAGSTADGKADDKRQPIEHIIVDTPGQIEVFVWSASGDILLGALASSFPTVIAYVIDTPRTASTATFMSNMLYACSILYKTKLPMVLVFNKTDVKDADFAKEWMTDFDAFQDALREEEENGTFGADNTGVAGSGYMSSLLNSMSLVLEEFYSHLSVVGVSAMTGDGVEEFFDAVRGKAEEFERDYRPELERRRKQREADKDAKRESELGKLLKDMNVSKTAGDSSRRKDKPPTPMREEPETISDIEEDSDPEAGAIIDPDEPVMRDGDADMEARYQKAMENDPGKGNPSEEDFSFVRYMHSANIG